jgi:formylglycine-generating enzyme required for sulfatase activity
MVFFKFIRGDGAEGSIVRRSPEKFDIGGSVRAASCLLVLMVWVATASIVLAQTLSEPAARAKAEAFREQVVRVQTEASAGGPGEEGFGLIVGSESNPDRVYIATPYHVAFGRNPRDSPLKDTARIVFYWDPNAPGIVARRLDRAASPRDDLAVLEAPVGTVSHLPHAPVVSADRIPIGSWVWNIGNAGDWELPFRAGGLGTIDPLTEWRKVGALPTPPGASGGAAVTEAGVIGMVLEDGGAGAYSLVLPAQRILDLFRAWRLAVNLLGASEAPPAPRVGEVFQDCSDCPAMVLIPGGSFLMGSPAGETDRDSDEGPQQRVTIAPFAAGRFDVTFAQWDACVAGGGCNGYRPSDDGWGRGDRPVIEVSWQDARSYVDWLSQRTGKRYRLLTEAEWEYAARAGTTTAFSTGRMITPEQAQYDWSYAGSSTRSSGPGRTAPVGQFPPNGFGLYDMHGNAWEWVQDCFRDTLSGQPEGGKAYEGGDCTLRVLRGGSWDSIPRGLRSAFRATSTPGGRGSRVGFRVARTL